MSFEEMLPTELEGFSYTGKNIFKLGRRLIFACPSCERRYYILKENAKYLCFQPEDFTASVENLLGL